MRSYSYLNNDIRTKKSKYSRIYLYTFLSSYSKYFLIINIIFTNFWKKYYYTLVNKNKSIFRLWILMKWY